MLAIFICDAEAQDLRLEISVPTRKIKASEPVDLTIKMVNGSTKPYYVCGDIALGSFGLGHELGRYELQVRNAGTSAFKSVGGTAVDGFPAKTPTVSDVIVNNGLVLLKGGMFVGSIEHSNWDGLTLLEPGRYSIRVTYDTYEPDRSRVPKEIRFPVFLQRLVSNVINIEIQP